MQKLDEFDPSLVIVPSRQGFFYRLAQRRKLNIPMQMVNDCLFNDSDTKMLATYGLIPVTTIVATVNWSNPLIFQELNNRAPHRQGGADAATKMLEESEARAELKKAAETDEMLTDISRDAWGFYLKKAGLRTHAYVPRTKVASTTSQKAAAVRVVPKTLNNRIDVATSFSK